MVRATSLHPDTTGHPLCPPGVRRAARVGLVGRCQTVVVGATSGSPTHTYVRDVTLEEMQKLAVKHRAIGFHL